MEGIHYGPFGVCAEMNVNRETSIRRIPVLALVILLGLAPACAKEIGVSGQVRLWTDRASYLMGEEGHLTLVTDHPGGIAIAADRRCWATIQRRVSGTWQPIGPVGWTYAEKGVASCTLEGLVLGPGATRSVAFLVDPRFQPGEEYRFVVSLHYEREAVGGVAVSNVFTVDR